jgi:hypothetical protein
MSFTKTKYDSCFSNQQQSSNKSIFNYVVDDSKFINVNECNNYTPPFLTYIPTGVSSKNMDIEHDLKGMTRPYTRCASCQYSGEIVNATNDATINQNQLNIHPNNKKECMLTHNILPNGYQAR